MELHGYYREKNKQTNPAMQLSWTGDSGIFFYKRLKSNRSKLKVMQKFSHQKLIREKLPEQLGNRERQMKRN